MQTQIDHFANMVWQHFRKTIADYKSVLTRLKTSLACTVYNGEAYDPGIRIKSKESGIGSKWSRTLLVKV